jgi:hypothetical protein
LNGVRSMAKLKYVMPIPSIRFISVGYVILSLRSFCSAVAAVRLVRS